MGNFKILLICGLAMNLTFACVTKVIQQQPPSPLAKILKDQTLWGKDYPAALAYLESWSKIGERTVEVFPEGVLGTTPYNSPEKVQQAAKQLAQAMKEPQPQPNDEFEDLLREPRKNPPPFQAEVISFLADVDSMRVVWTGTPLQLLAPNLSLATVEERLGQPEKVTQEVVPSVGELRPIVLTLYGYAGSKVAFAESDWAPRPGFVDRVIFDLPAVTTVVFK
ncbi:MAG: hypothetical protein GWO20_01825 [Candidatus Korarchaeota archaeon]|nr:hypothetical protein [Candidatus Korarchaeota archaeon]